jgi:hypothetical protein
MSGIIANPQSDEGLADRIAHMQQFGAERLLALAEISLDD